MSASLHHLKSPRFFLPTLLPDSHWCISRPLITLARSKQPLASAHPLFTVSTDRRTSEIVGNLGTILARTTTTFSTMTHPFLHQPICASTQNMSIPSTETSHPEDPIPKEPEIPLQSLEALEIDTTYSAPSSTDDSSNELSTPSTPTRDSTDTSLSASTSKSTSSKRRGSTVLISNGPADVRRILNSGGTQYVGKVCCGGGCCFMTEVRDQVSVNKDSPTVVPPDNAAYRSLNIPLSVLSLQSTLTNVTDLPALTVSLEGVKSKQDVHSTVTHHPPEFVTPHPPHSVFASKMTHARELTGPGAEKKTFHMEFDVTDYPEESGTVDFVVGGAIGICASNDEQTVNDIFDTLGVPSFVRDKPVLLKTTGGRWPTIWGEEEARELYTTRRELLTWCSDVQSFPPTKQLLRVLAEYADNPDEKKILLYLTSAQGQPAFCDLRTSANITLLQLLHAFPSSKPPLDYLFSVLNTLMPRFYSLSQDPSIIRQKDGLNHRVIEIAVTLHETTDWNGNTRTGVGSGFLTRMAQKVAAAEAQGILDQIKHDIPMFRGLMANPLAKEFRSDGPMLLIGAGVGIAPFRGFVQRRLRSANCANKVWVLQGVRDSLVDELYRGEWGVADEEVRKVVQSRVGKGKYVQEEVRHQSDLVWFIINSVDGRIFVCGSSKGMGEGVELALTDVAMEKGNLNRSEAEAFWKQKKAEGQYVVETW